MSIDKNSYYKMIAPRPTVCVSTQDGDGNSNIAPYSFVTPLSFRPPLLGVAVGKGKDTMLNARETEDFVVAPLTKSWIKKGIKSEVSLDREKSEFEEVGLTEKDSREVDSPSVKESPINIECEFWDEFEGGDHYLLVGEVVHISGKESALRNGRINLEELVTVNHISGEEFCLSKEVTEIER